MAFSGNPNHNQPTLSFDTQKLFKPPVQNPNPNLNPLNPNVSPNLYPFFCPTYTPFHYLGNTNPNPNPSANHGARLMTFLGATPPFHLAHAVSLPPPPEPMLSTADFLPILQATSAPMARVASTKMPRGRFLSTEERATYDVDSRVMGESMPPQLEATPITKYAWDPSLVLGRQIAVNRSYISYGLKMGSIRILNIDTALRALLKGHSQKVTDMAFFAEDVHLLASASVGGKVIIWKIDEGPDEESRPQITGKIVLAIQIGDGESYHPRICWHSHKQEVLIVAIENLVLKIDSTRVGRGKEFCADDPLRCPVEKLVDGIQIIGKHEGDVTDLSISQWMTTCLASASKDGTVKIWDDRKTVPLVTLRPHQGEPVSSVAFLTSPQRPGHIVLITGGYLNREIKIWTSTSKEGWLLSSDSETLQCTQTLELLSSAEPQPEEAFFNQVVVLPRASLILLANAKKNALYAVHVNYGPHPASTRMDYIADFSVTMPILSLTGISESLPGGEQVVQVYCVQTQAIQQYALDLYQCLPPQVDTPLGRDSGIRVSDAPSLDGLTMLEPSRVPTTGAFPIDNVAANTFVPGFSSVSTQTVHPVSSLTSEVYGVLEWATSNAEVKPSAPPLLSSGAAIADSVHSSAPSNLHFSLGPSFLRSPSESLGQGASSSYPHVSQPVDHRAKGRVDNVLTNVPDDPYVVDNSGKDESKTGVNGDDLMTNSRLTFKLGGNTTHLVTLSEILSGAVSSLENIHISQGLQSEEIKVQDAINNNDINGKHVQVKHVNENKHGHHDHSDSQKEAQVVDETNSVNILTSEVNMEVPKDVCFLTSDSCSINQAPRDCISVCETLGQHSLHGEEEVQENRKDLPDMESASKMKGKKQKAKQSQAWELPSPSLTLCNLTDPLDKLGSNLGLSSIDSTFSQLQSMEHMLTQLMNMQKEMQKQISSVVAGPVNKEGKRVETALGRSMEKAVKANADALWARFQEENAKHEKAAKEHVQQLTSLLTNCMNKDFPAMLERAVKKEISSIGSSLARAVTPVIEKSTSSAITDSFQRGVGDKAVGQLEKTVNSKLEATVARQIQSQFQTSGRQALEEALRFCLESSVIPAFEQSCKGMFEKVDATFQKGMNEQAGAAQQQFESAHGPMVLALRDAINSASSLTQNLTGELVDGQCKILALLTGNTQAANPIVLQRSAGPTGGLVEMKALPLQEIEASLDPTKELSRLISEHKFGEAFTMALQRSDVAIVSWLCFKVDLHAICSMSPLPLNQGVLLSLLQQLACDIGTETARKLGWMTDVAVAINPTDPLIALHARPIFEQVYNMLAHRRSLPTITASESTKIRIIMHVINSVLLSCK